MGEGPRCLLLEVASLHVLSSTALDSRGFNLSLHQFRLFMVSRLFSSLFFASFQLRAPLQEYSEVSQVDGNNGWVDLQCTQGCANQRAADHIDSYRLYDSCVHRS